jgi:DNA-binding LacI/PurR family transcriptional regulator
VLCATDAVAPEEERALDTLLELRVDGLVLASPLRGLDSMLARVSRELPVIVVAGPSSVTRVDSIRSDDGEGAALVVRHLVELGHRRIAYLDDASGPSMPERRAGYERVMHAHGLGAHVRVVAGSHGERGIAALLATGARPTAIFAANDVAAFGAIGELGEHGLHVPADVSVAGYDNTLLSSMRNVALTTVDQPRATMGRQAVAMLLERLSGERDTPRHVVTTPTLVVRGTTAPPG